MIQIDMKSHKSIYQQVIDNIKELIMCDILPPDSKLPSVRDLSRQLTINPNTVQKAFKELEREGYIYTVAGRGSFVSEKEQGAPDADRLQKIRADQENVYRELRLAGMQPREAESFVRDVVAERVRAEECMDDLERGRM